MSYTVTTGKCLTELNVNEIKMYKLLLVTATLPKVKSSKSRLVGNIDF